MEKEFVEDLWSSIIHMVCVVICAINVSLIFANLAKMDPIEEDLQIKIYLNSIHNFVFLNLIILVVFILVRYRNDPHEGFRPSRNFILYTILLPFTCLQIFISGMEIISKSCQVGSFEFWISIPKYALPLLLLVVFMNRNRILQPSQLTLGCVCRKLFVSLLLLAVLFIIMENLLTQMFKGYSFPTCNLYLNSSINLYYMRNITISFLVCAASYSVILLKGLNIHQPRSGTNELAMVQNRKNKTTVIPSFVVVVAILFTTISTLTLNQDIAKSYRLYILTMRFVAYCSILVMGVIQILEVKNWKPIRSPLVTIDTLIIWVGFFTLISESIYTMSYAVNRYGTNSTYFDAHSNYRISIGSVSILASFVLTMLLDLMSRRFITRPKAQSWAENLCPLFFIMNLNFSLLVMDIGQDLLVSSNLRPSFFHCLVLGASITYLQRFYTTMVCLKALNFIYH